MIAFDTDSCSQCHRRFNCEVVTLCQFYLGNYLIMDEKERINIGKKIIGTCSHIIDIKVTKPLIDSYTLDAGPVELLILFPDTKVKMEEVPS